MHGGNVVLKQNQLPQRGVALEDVSQRVPPSIAAEGVHSVVDL
jgi:hypothetical protein